MKQLIIMLICLVFVPVVIAGDFATKYQIKSDPVRGAGNYLIRNDNGNETGRIKRNPLWPSNSGRYLILDKKGNVRGPSSRITFGLIDGLLKQRNKTES